MCITEPCWAHVHDAHDGMQHVGCELVIDVSIIEDERVKL